MSDHDSAVQLDSSLSIGLAFSLMVAFFGFLGLSLSLKCTSTTKPKKKRKKKKRKNENWSKCIGACRLLSWYSFGFWVHRVQFGLSSFHALSCPTQTLSWPSWNLIVLINARIYQASLGCTLIWGLSLFGQGADNFYTTGLLWLI